MIATLKTIVLIVRSLYRMSGNERALVIHYVERIESAREAA